MKTVNYDPAEIAQFNQMASEWWNPNGPLKTLHVIHPTRLAYIQQRTNISGKKTVDIGCGAGLITESFAQLGAIATGIDLSSEALEAAKLHQQKNHLMIDYQHISTETFAKEHPQSFDVITCLEMLEHVPDPTSIIQACALLAKPNADLFFSTLNRTPLAYFGAIVAAEYFLKLLPRNTHDYRKFIRPGELDRWITEAGLILIDIQGIQYDPLKNISKLTQNVSINYIVHAKKK